MSGVNEIPSSNNLLSHSKSSPKTQHWPPVREPEVIRPTPKWRAPNDTGSPLIDKLCFIMGIIWLVVLLLCLLSFGVTAIFANAQRTIMLTDMPDLASGDDLAAAMAFALIFGAGASRSIGGTIPKIALRSLGLGSMLFMLLLVPLIITGQQIIEAWSFSGNTDQSVQTFRINGVSAYHGKYGWKYGASINPLHCASCMPSIQVNQTAYQFIINQGEISNAQDQPQLSRTKLCMTFKVESAGRLERIIVANRGLWGVDDIKRCPSSVH